MTEATTKPSIAERLKDEHPQAIDTVRKTTLAGALALTLVQDEATMYDALVAIESFLDSLGAANAELPLAFDPTQRPASDDTRPLYQRLDDNPDTSHIWKGFLRNLNQAEAYMSPAVAEAYHAELGKLFKAFGLPLSREEFEANRDAYPGVS